MSDQTTRTQQDPQSPTRPPAGPPRGLRLWPGIVLVVAMWLVRGWASMGKRRRTNFSPACDRAAVALLGVLLWWLFASRLRWSAGLLVAGTLVAVTVGTQFAAEPSVRGMVLVIYALPIVLSAWLGWLALSFGLAWPLRRAGILLIFIATGVVCLMFRVDGMSGNFVAKFSWRWTLTPEEKLLAELKARPAPPSDVQAAKSASSRATGPVSEGRGATAACRACGSRPIGNNRRRRSCGGTASAPAGRR